MTSIKVINGGISSDHRGKIIHVNDLDMSNVERFYTIHHPDTTTIRAWHGHQDEKKWFHVVAGSFTAAFVKIDDWDNPSADLKPEVFQLSASESRVICVPEGYANGMKANEPNSIMLVFSSKILTEAVHDSWRYDANLWMNW